MASLSNLKKLKIKTVLVITLLWILFLALVFIYEFSSYKFRFPDWYATANIWTEFWVLMLAGLLAGLIGGTFFVFNINAKAQKRPFYYGILLSAIYFLLIYFFISTAMGMIILSVQRGQSPFHPEVLRITFAENLIAPFQLRNIMVWTFIVVVTQFMLQVNDKFGPGNLWKIFTGKYYTPKEELRVFMFLDLKSSTTIAEKFGHQRYYLFLNEFYGLISDPIINRDGEIYQYVGDEVVVSWTAQKAIKNLNCLQCFFDIKATIEKNKQIFEEKYKLVPTFKAGIHFGPVTVGEIGIIKRDIVFTGDVLNTTARIQSSCNALQTDLLVSENTLALFDYLGPFKATFLDEIELRGKEKKVKVFTLGDVGENG